MKWLQALGVAAAAVAVALGIWLIVANDVANRRLIAVEKAWAEAPGSLDAFPMRFPSSATNEAARRLEAAAASLGVDLKPRVEKGPGPGRNATREEIRIDGLFREYLESQLQRVEASARPPEGEAALFLVRNAPQIEAVRQVLETSEPRWRCAVEKGYEAPLPNLLGQLRLQRILLAAVLSAGAAGDAAPASSLLEASWRLNRSLWVRPDLISQLIAIIVARMQAGILRKAPVEPGPWIARISEVDPRRGVLESFRGEAWVAREAQRHGVLIDPESGEPMAPSRLAAFVRGPVERLRICGWLGGLREVVVVAGSRPVSDGSPESLRSAYETGARKWGRSPNLASLLQSFERADRLIVDLELTRKVLELRAARGIAREWPAAVPGIENSVVKDARWAYTRTADARASLELSRLLDWGKSFGLVLPTRWVSAN